MFGDILFNKKWASWRGGNFRQSLIFFFLCEVRTINRIPGIWLLAQLCEVWIMINKYELMLYHKIIFTFQVAFVGVN